jgi:putative acetyltransferase
VIIRPETPADHEAIFAVQEAAFGKAAEARLVDAIRASDRYMPELSLVAEEDGEVVGHTMLSYVDVDHARVLTLSPIGVRPDRQGRGIGGALVREALRLADGRGEPLVVLEGDPAYYGRFGFRPAGELGIELATPAPEGAFQAIPLTAYDPELRGRLVYPHAFDVAEEPVRPTWVERLVGRVSHDV